MTPTQRLAEIRKLNVWKLFFGRRHEHAWTRDEHNHFRRSCACGAYGFLMESPISAVGVPKYHWVDYEADKRFDRAKGEEGSAEE